LNKKFLYHILSRAIFCLAFLLGTAEVSGQKKIALDLVSVDQSELDIGALQTSFKDSTALVNYLNEYIMSLRKDSYLSASLDTLSLTDSTARASVFLGEKYTIRNIRYENIPLGLIKSIRADSKKTGDAVSKQSLKELTDEIIKRYENSGYPFARIDLDSFIISDKEIDLKLTLEEGYLIHLDSIDVQGNLLLRNGYLHRYLDVEKGSPFNKKKLDKVNQRLENLSFLQKKKDASLTFKGTSATLELHVDERSASRFDFLFGIIPSDNLGERSIFLSFDGTAEMVNKLGGGERLFFQFQRLRPESQQLDVELSYPYILNLPFGADLNLEIYRNAENFIDVDIDYGLSYLYNGSDYLKLYWGYESSRLVQVDTAAILAIQRLPDRLDVVNNGLGIAFQYNNLDYIYNPRRGFYTYFNIYGGLKEIRENNTITSFITEEVDFSDSYDSLDLNGYKINLEADINYYKGLGDRGTLKIQSRTGYQFSNQENFENERFRIGGNKLLRGFDEESFFVDFYQIFTLEYRLLLSKNSYLSLPFIDVGVIRYNTQEGPFLDNALGIGAGLSFETTAGIFQFSIAVGRQKEIPFDLGKPKAHIGFESLF